MHEPSYDSQEKRKYKLRFEGMRATGGPHTFPDRAHTDAIGRA
ncbi:hypothetical protein H4687_003369 [Streptomyces stelliscabiei]|uniref:Uncharacterized protein n=1 Tax=Streptomyces stelliscabiei TaxID=146820 RepID=A0A8I0P793_9ACTN|nr:hypothetical protein [Streptomyces stelliscabiei]